MFWPDSDPDAARLNLRVALNSLRRQLEPLPQHTGSIWITTRHSVGIDPDSISTDTRAFEAAARAAKEAGDSSEWVPRIREALAIYRGPLLPEFDDDWIVGERERLSSIHRDAVERLCRWLCDEGDLDEAIPLARQAADDQPYDDDAHERLIRLLLARGRKSDAAECCRQYGERLRSELGVQPSQAILSLSAALKPYGVIPAKETRRRRAIRTRAVQEAKEGEAIAKQPASRGSLPPRLTTFFGRNEELGLLQRFLTDPTGARRLVSVTGMGGCGKTRLLVETAEATAAHFSGGLWFVDLSGLSDPNHIQPAICAALGVQALAETEFAALIAGALGSGPALIALDNLEQLLPSERQPSSAAITTVCGLLEAAPTLTMVVTSRQRIGIAPEQELRLEPLEVPRTGTELADLATIPSVAMFVDRARLVQPDFGVTPRNAKAVSAICRLVEGIPLAIELAAAWSHTLPPAQIEERLSRREPVLVSRNRWGTERHRSLRSALAWSFDLLPDEVCRFLAQLSVFRGGFTIEAANEVSGLPDSLNFLADLRERSLLQAREVGSSKRFRLLESVREFAAEALTDPEAFNLAERHAAYFQRLAAAARPCIRTWRQTDWLSRLDDEEDNLRAAIEWCLANRPLEAADLMRDLAPYWALTSRDQVAIEWLSRLEPVLPEESLRRCVADIALARFHLRCLRREEARPFLDRALGNAEGMSSPDLRADAAYCRAHIDLQSADLDAAKEAFQLAFAQFETVGRTAGAADSLINLGHIASRTGRREEAKEFAKRALTLSEEVGDFRNLTVVTANLSALATEEGSYAEAQRLSEKALALAQKAGDRLWEAVAWFSLGRHLIYQSSLPRAGKAVQTSLRLLANDPSFFVCESIAQCHFAELDRLTGLAKRAESRCRRVLADKRRLSDAEALVRLCMARLALDRDDQSAAIPFLRECLTVVEPFAYPKEILTVIEMVSLCLALGGRLEQAAYLMAEAAKTRGAIPVRDPLERPYYERALSLIPDDLIEAASKGTGAAPLSVKELGAQALAALD